MLPDHPSAVVPVLETERLVLWGPRADDLAESGAMWSDPKVTRYIGGRPSTEEESWRRLLQFAGLWAWLGYGYWTVREKETDGFVGSVGFGDFRRDVRPRFHGVPEAGWVLSPSAQGRGFATEALRAVLAWADARFPRTVCIIAPENGPSVRVAEKVGYRALARTTYKDEPTLLFERLRPSGTPG